MHTVVIGVGGVGGYFGGKIALSGQQVSMLARGKHLEVIQQNGLKVQSIAGDFTIRPYLATDTIAAIGAADLILICTKSWQVQDAAQCITPLLKASSVVIPLQNGADNVAKLLTVLEPKHVVGGLCKIYSKIEAPGIISHFGHDPEVIFGELHGEISPRMASIKAVFDTAGFRATIPSDIQVAIWTKFMFIATVSGLGAITRATLGEMYAYQGTRELLQQLATEIYTIGKAKGVQLPDDAAEKCMHFISKQPYNATASTQRDIMAGRPSELENFNGYLVAQGERLGIPTPAHHFVYTSLIPQEMKARSQKV